MPCISQQRERARDDPPDNLGNHEEARQNSGNRESSLAPPIYMVVIIKIMVGQALTFTVGMSVMM